MTERFKPVIRFIIPFIIFFSFLTQTFGNKLLIPMDESQRNHLKSYGIAYWILSKYDTEIDWLLNYRGGTFMVDYNSAFATEMTLRGWVFLVVSVSDATT